MRTMRVEIVVVTVIVIAVVVIVWMPSRVLCRAVLSLAYAPRVRETTSVSLPRAPLPPTCVLHRFSHRWYVPSSPHHHVSRLGRTRRSHRIRCRCCSRLCLLSVFLDAPSAHCLRLSGIRPSLSFSPSPQLSASSSFRSRSMTAHGLRHLPSVTARVCVLVSPVLPFPLLFRCSPLWREVAFLFPSFRSSHSYVVLFVFSPPFAIPTMDQTLGWRPKGDSVVVSFALAVSFALHGSPPDVSMRCCGVSDLCTITIRLCVVAVVAAVLSLILYCLRRYDETSPFLLPSVRVFSPRDTCPRTKTLSRVSRSRRSVSCRSMSLARIVHRPALLHSRSLCLCVCPPPLQVCLSTHVRTRRRVCLFLVSLSDPRVFYARPTSLLRTPCSLYLPGDVPSTSCRSKGVGRPTAHPDVYIPCSLPFCRCCGCLLRSHCRRRCGVMRCPHVPTAPLLL